MAGNEERNASHRLGKGAGDNFRPVYDDLMDGELGISYLIEQYRTMSDDYLLGIKAICDKDGKQYTTLLYDELRERKLIE